MKKVLIVIVSLSLLGLVGCSTAPTQVLEEAPESSAIALPEYTIGVGDSLSVSVWRNEELSQTVAVRPDGNISLPLIGEVKAFGKTPGKLSTDLQSLLVNFVRNPQVTVIVAGAASADYQNRVRITGAIEQPLSVPYREGMTVLDIVLEAGGTSEFAVANKSVLYRKTADGVKSYRIKLKDILKKGDLSTNYSLVPSDVLIVPERLL